MRAKYVYNVPDGAPFSAFEAVCDDIVNIFCGGAIAATSSYCVKAESFTAGASGGWTLVSKTPNAYQGFEWVVNHAFSRVGKPTAVLRFRTEPTKEQPTTGYTKAHVAGGTQGFLLDVLPEAGWEGTPASVRILVPYTRIPIPPYIVSVMYGVVQSNAVAMFCTDAVTTVAGLYSLNGDMGNPHAVVDAYLGREEIVRGFFQPGNLHPRNYRGRHALLGTIDANYPVVMSKLDGTPGIAPIVHTAQVLADGLTDTYDTYWDGVKFRGVCYEPSYRAAVAIPPGNCNNGGTTPLNTCLLSYVAGMYLGVPTAAYGFPLVRAFDEVSFNGDVFVGLPIVTTEWTNLGLPAPPKFVRAPLLVLIRKD